MPVQNRAVAGLVVWLTGFTRADALAALVVAALMVKAGWGLVRESGRIFLEAAPAGTDPERIGAQLVAMPGVVEVHDLHIWQITSGEPALSAHVLVNRTEDCHQARCAIERVLRDEHGLEHTTLQVDHAVAGRDSEHCAESHGVVHRAAEGLAG